MTTEELIKTITDCLNEKEKLQSELEKECIILVNLKSNLNNRMNRFMISTDFKGKGLTNQGLQKSYVDEQCKNLNHNVEMQKIKVKTLENRIKFLSEKIKTLLELNKLTLEGELNGECI